MSWRKDFTATLPMNESNFSNQAPAALDELYETAQMEAQANEVLDEVLVCVKEEADEVVETSERVEPSAILDSRSFEEVQDADEASISNMYPNSKEEALHLSSSEDEEDVSDVSDEGLDSSLVELLSALQDSAPGEYDPQVENLVDRVQVDSKTSQAVIDDLISHGTFKFIEKYILADPRPMTTPQILAALGFNLPLSVVNDPKYDPQHFEMALQVAMRYTMKTRARLPAPRTLPEVVSLIENSKNILVVTGAGISTSLGIPDFRSDNGLYAQLEDLGLADPQEVFDIRLFKEDPSIFYSVAAKILPEEGIHNGTPTHKFIKMLDERNKLLRNYTQNIDNLEQFVGIQAERLVQCHGSFGSAHCITCGHYEPNGEKLFPDIKDLKVPICPECSERQKKHKRKYKKDEDDGEEDEDLSYGAMKPDITFFGEALPPRFDKMLLDEGDADKCDLVICLGTSLRVSPVSEIVKVVNRQVPQIYISKTPAIHLNFEISFLGGCDDTVELLCQALGWPIEHPMVKRPKDMPDNEFPGGTIKSSDGVFKFIDASPMEET